MIIAILAAAILNGQPAGAASAPSAAPPPAAAAPAGPTPSAGAGAPATKVATNDDDKVVCKSEQVTGSRFSRRICHTKSEWTQIEKDSRDELMDQQSQSYRNPTNGH